MDSTVFDFVWQGIVRRQFAAADAIDKVRFPELLQRALDEVTKFSRLPAPDSGHELNIRRVSAYSMARNWDAEMNRTLRTHS